MQNTIKKMVTDVKIKHLSYDAGENQYKLVNDTRFSVRFKGKSSIGMLSHLRPSEILCGQSGVGRLTVISPEVLGDDFLSGGFVDIELAGIVVAECEFKDYTIEVINL